MMLVGMLSASAQTEDDFLSKVTVRPTLGLNICSEDAGGNASSSLVSFKVGAIADYAFKENWGFRSGILFSGQGGTFKSDVGSGWLSWSSKATDNPWYLEIPLDVYYSYQIKDITLTGFTGIPVSIGLFGNYKIEDGGSGTGTVGTTKQNAFDDLNRFALSYNIGIEATWRKMSFGFEYSRHLTNDGKNGSGHLQLFSINLGYNFKL